MIAIEGPHGCRFVSPRLWEVTDLGLNIWRRVQAFYAAAAEPSDDLAPLATEEGELADMSRKTRRRLIGCRARRQVKKMFEPDQGKGDGS